MSAVMERDSTRLAPAATQVFDALPEGEADDLRSNFRRGAFYPYSQAVPGKYAQWQRPDMPGGEDEFTASFSRATGLENDAAVHACISRFIAPRVERSLGVGIRKITLRAYRLSCGDHFRAHSDHELGQASFVLYLSKGWKWDWGGLLVAVPDAGEPRVFLPRWNSLAILGQGVPHFVTSVERHAKEPRFMLAGFCATVPA
jgi:Rps23 Pro-64 3,4-dihydroxylase Tpa1-like proline 4-hydroxylase